MTEDAGRVDGRNKSGIYRDLYRRLETLYPSLADLPAA